MKPTSRGIILRCMTLLSQQHRWMGLLFATLFEESHWPAARDYPNWKCDSDQNLGLGWKTLKSYGSLLQAVQKYFLFLFFSYCPVACPRCVSTLEVFRNILVLPITHFGSCYAHFGPVMRTQNVQNKTHIV
jgi:hypothetical protein